MKPGPSILAAVALVALAARWGRLPPRARVLGSAVALGLAVWGSGVIDLPNLETIARDVGATLGSYTYAAVGVLAFLETGVGVGLVAPGELAVVIGGVTAGQGHTELVPLIAIVWASALAGDLTSYVLGRRLGRDFLLRHGAALKLTPQRLRRVETFIANHGGKTIIVGRFIGLVRALAPFVAGSSRMPVRRFIPAAFVAAGIWSATFTVLGLIFWQSFDRAEAIAKQGTLALLALVIGAAALVVVYRRLRARGAGHPLRSATEDEGAHPFPSRLRPANLGGGIDQGDAMINAAESHVRRAGEGLEESARQTRLLIVDDHPAVRAGLRDLLEDQPEFTVWAAVATAEEALAIAEREPIDVAVVDYQLGSRNGLWLSRKLKRLPSPPFVLIYSAYADDVLAAAAVVAEADAIVSKGGLGAELCDQIRRMARGHSGLRPVPPWLGDAIRSRFDHQEQAIFGMLLAGIPLGEIAETLDLSDPGLDARLSAMLRKLQPPLPNNRPPASAAA